MAEDSQKRVQKNTRETQKELIENGAKIVMTAIILKAVYKLLGLVLNGKM